MAELTDFIASCKNLDLQHGNINDLGSDLITQAILDALMEYSEYEPRGQRTASVEIEVDDTEILLPADCLVLSDEVAFLLFHGYNPPKYPVPGAYPPRITHKSYYGTAPLDNTTDLPFNTSQQDPSIIPISTSNSGRISILLNTAITSARTHVIRYDAYHIISNDPNVNTVKHSDRRKLRKLVLSYFYDARHRIALEQNDLALAKEMAKAAAKYESVKDEFCTAFGGF